MENEEKHKGIAEAAGWDAAQALGMAPSKNESETRDGANLPRGLSANRLILGSSPVVVGL